MKTYASIDASNLFYGGKKSLGWSVDFEKLYKKFLDEKGIKTNVFKDNDFLFAFFTANEIDHLTKEKP